MAAPPPPSGRADEVRLAVPAQPDYVQVARLTVTAIAERVGFSYDEIEDLRIAVGEMCSILVLDEPGARMTVRCSTSEDEVVIEAGREPAEPALRIGELSEQILRSVVDRLEVDPTGARLTVAKRLQS